MNKYKDNLNKWIILNLMNKNNYNYIYGECLIRIVIRHNYI